jgi:hypothetical protein
LLYSYPIELLAQKEISFFLLAPLNIAQYFKHFRAKRKTGATVDSSNIFARRFVKFHQYLQRINSSDVCLINSRDRLMDVALCANILAV